MSTLRELKQRARRVVNTYAMSAGGGAAVTGPVPGTSAALTAAEAALCQHVARVYGYNLTLVEAGCTMAGLISASGALKHVAHETLTFVPIVGWIAKGVLASGFCKTVGELAINHFEDKYKADRNLS